MCVLSKDITFHRQHRTVLPVFRFAVLVFIRNTSQGFYLIAVCRQAKHKFQNYAMMWFCLFVCFLWKITRFSISLVI